MSANDKRLLLRQERDRRKSQPKTKQELQKWLKNYCIGLKDHGEPNTWDVTLVMDMSELFKNLATFNEPLDQWNTSQVTDMSWMFQGATTFNQNINSWDTSQVTTMTYMFWRATAFNQPLTFDTSQVTTMSAMFEDARAFNNGEQPLTLDTKQVTDMTDMFESATAFNQPLTFNTSQVTDMTGMFNNATLFDQPLTFDTSKVTDMRSMFEDAIAFNQPLTDWDVSQVTSMQYMFEGATAMSHKLNEDKASKCSAKDGPLPSIGPPTILTAVKDKVYRYEWPELWPDFRCVITEDREPEESKDGVDGWLREYGVFRNETDGNGQSERKVIVTSTPSEISIELVYLGKASGICTLAVASVLYAVLDRINKKGHFPTKGKVYIQSVNGCRAFNCYNRAFRINGFELEPDDQYEDVQEYARTGNSSYGDFRYTLHYYSKRQAKLKNVDQAKYVYQAETALEKAKAEYHQYVKDLFVPDIAKLTAGGRNTPVSFNA